MTTNLAQVFGEYNQTTIRWNEDPAFPVWVAKDVCKALEIKWDGHQLDKFDEDEKGRVFIHTPGGKQEMMGVSEPGLYRLVFNSKKEGAKKFQHWVFHEVLPQIRKTGSYNSQNLSPAEVALKHAEALVALEKEQAQHAQKLLEHDSGIEQAQNAASEAKQGLEDIYSELASLKEFAVAQPSDLNQSQTEQITQAFQRLGSVLEEAGIYQGCRAYREPWKQLGLTMRNSSLKYDLNARKANEDERYNKALEQWKANGKKGKKPKKLSRIQILNRDGQANNAFQAAQQVVSDYLSRL